MTGELNPNHPVTQQLREMWHKVCAVMIHKQGLTEVRISEDDVKRFTSCGMGAITFSTRNGEIILSLVDEKSAARIAREEGCLPV